MPHVHDGLTWAMKTMLDQDLSVARLDLGNSEMSQATELPDAIVDDLASVARVAVPREGDAVAVDLSIRAVHVVVPITVDGLTRRVRNSRGVCKGFSFFQEMIWGEEGMAY